MLTFRIVRSIRQFLDDSEFVEVETPALQVSPGLEPHLSAFRTELEAPGRAGSAGALYLHTSPEFAMKKLLAGGMERIWQIAPVFRNAERSRTHHPEFRMLEWYRAGEKSAALIEDCRDIFCAALKAVASRECFTWRGRHCDQT